MSIVVTNIAAGVANTAAAAEQTARKRDRVEADDTKRARDIREIVETTMRGIEEGEDGAAEQLHIDGQLPGHQTPAMERKEARRHEHQAVEALRNRRDDPAGDDDGQQPYKRLDVQA